MIQIKDLVQILPEILLVGGRKGNGSGYNQEMAPPTSARPPQINNRHTHTGLYRKNMHDEVIM